MEAFGFSLISLSNFPKSLSLIVLVVFTVVVSDFTFSLFALITG